MIFVQDYDDVLKGLGKEFFVFDSIAYVSDLSAWAKTKDVDLSEPYQPIKLIASDGNKLLMVAQSEIREEVLDGIITGLGVRWSLVDNVSDTAARLNSTKKRLAFCFLKEYARTVEDVAQDELHQDEWAIRQMEKLGFFNE